MHAIRKARKSCAVLWGLGAILLVGGLGPASHAQQISSPAAPVSITLEEAIHRAQQNEPAFAAALADQRAAALEVPIARAALLPSASVHNQVLYTQSNGLHNQGGQTGSQPAPIFVANNAVHEYATQAQVNETLGLKQFADIRLASATAARASAELEIERRGLVVAVVNLYYDLVGAENKQRLLQQSLQDATAFTKLTNEREAAREAAHADVIKAELEQQQRQRDVLDQQVQVEKARLDLAVLLFPDPRISYTVVNPAPAPLPSHNQVETAAAMNNPEMKSALAAVAESDAGVLAARTAYLPDLGLNFTYGIDAPQFAMHGPQDANNLGYSLSATLDIPVWDWLQTAHRVKQSEIRRDAARAALTATQRRWIATLEETYAEASTAFAQINLLQQTAQTAEESLRLTKLRYTAGEGTVFEVVDAQNQWIAAQIAEVDGQARYASALAALETITGNL